MKYTKFADIPQQISDGSWECNYSAVYLVNYIEDMKKTEGLQMNPDFQRGHVWTERQQIAYIEAVLQGGAKNARVIYLNNPGWHGRINSGEYNDFVCVDGLQRYTAIQRFVNNEIKVFGSYRKDYIDDIRSRHEFRLNVNSLKTKEEVLKWYLQINDGGTPHTKEELDKVRKMLRD